MEKTKSSPFLKVLKGTGIFLAAVLVIFAAIFSFSALDKKSIVKVMPEDFTFYVHTDHLWDAVEPTLDLKAADTMLQGQNMTQLRGTFMKLRASELRNNKLLKLCANRKVDFAVYNNQGASDFIAILDLSFLSAATRLGKPFLKNLKISKIFYNSQSDFFEYRNGIQAFYIKPVKNLLLVSSSQQLLNKAVFEAPDYSEEKKQIILKKTSNPIRLIVDSQKLAESVFSQNQVFLKLASYISKDTLSSIEFSITNDAIDIAATLPLDFSAGTDALNENNSSTSENQTSEATTKLLQTASSAPAFISHMTSNVQYYTLINAGTIEELKNGIFPLLPESANADSIWKSAEHYSKMFFDLSLEELFFSWTGKEIIAFGLENKNDPVFAIQIADEKQRQYVFDKITSSIIIKDDSSLILDGVRLCKIDFPSVIENLLNLFNVNLTLPYFMIKDGYIYFSTSAENLASVYSALNHNQKLSQTKNWTAVSNKQNPATTISLYYNLERTVPFFLRSNANLAKTLELYSLGRFDLRIKNNSLNIQLHAISNKQPSSNVVPGFPVKLEGKNDGQLYSTSKAIYWIENSRRIMRMDLSSTNITSRSFNDPVYIATNDKSKNTDEVWALTDKGEVWLLDETLEAKEGFPVYSGERPSAKPVLLTGKNERLAFCTEEGILVQTQKDCQLSKLKLPVTGSVRSSPAAEASGTTEFIQVYDKGFLGQLITVKNDEIIEEPVSIAGIAFGSPALRAKGSDLYSGFITQKGDFTIYKNDEMVLKLQLDGIFNTNAVADKKYFYVVSNESVLTRIDSAGNTLSVKFSETTSENPFLKVIDDKVFVCADGNSIYAFDENLEIAYGYPVPGWGIPVFGDTNGDKNPEILALTIDKKIACYNIK